MGNDVAESLMHLALLGKSGSGSVVDILLMVLISAASSYLTRLLRARGAQEALARAASLAPGGWGRRRCVRVIRHVSARTDFCAEFSDARMHNAVLQNAVLVHARNTAPALFGRMAQGAISLSETNNDVRVMRAAGDDPAGGDCRDGRCYGRDGIRTKLILSPDSGRWELMRRETWKGEAAEIFIKTVATADERAGQTTKEVHVLGVCRADPAGLVEGFVASAYEAYRRELQREVESSQRYLFSPREPARDEDPGGRGGEASPRGGPRGGRAQTVYARHPLSDERGLDGVYHPRTDEVRRLLDDLEARAGKFAVPGHPRRAGFLLHGPPGCGKTSLIKGIAAHTKRHIVSVPLDKIGSNAELEDVMMSGAYRTVGREGAANIPQDRVVFVLEDVDAACDVVHRRAPPGGAPGEQEGAPGAKGGAADGVLLSALEEVVLGGRRPPRAAADRLTLSGLLNVLDGLQDTPGRVVVMTTNHPERLDPALIRPGRVTMNIRMGHLRAREAEAMFLKYFPGAGPEARRALAAATACSAVSPAELEMVCGASDTTEQALAALALLAPAGEADSP